MPPKPRGAAQGRERERRGPPFGGVVEASDVLVPEVEHRRSLAGVHRQLLRAELHDAALRAHARHGQRQRRPRGERQRRLLRQPREQGGERRVRGGRVQRLHVVEDEHEATGAPLRLGALDGQRDRRVQARRIVVLAVDA